MGLEVEEFPNEEKDKKISSHHFALSYDKLAALTNELTSALEIMKDE
eukprot:CAMPEP_0205803676 /NCGR_PEP_ID=MMETSP0205-20121125/6406_1 /ASSEMBLY_ACC=CAM_ASM_000278 /TAXON_ID=36767 /ORGANISM="Euplotes focardii, Strain TN1" /LENGTH=46 /DNA_ID= /DNA_START= /DNA_END= /DNA_ORIENTATION=